MARTGKIARLPRETRDELNRRLDAGQLGPKLLKWLNARPEVRAVLKEHFGGRPVSAENLSAWRQGGHADWLFEERMHDRTTRLEESMGHIRSTGALADNLTTAVCTRFVDLHYDWERISDEDKARQLKLLGPYCRHVTKLRKSEQDQARLALDRDKYELNQGWSKQQLVNFFFNWVQDIDVRGAVLYLQELSQEELMDKIKQVFGLAADWKPPGDWTDEDRARAKAKGDELRKMAAQVKAEQAEQKARQARAQEEEDRQQAEWQAQGLPPDVQATLDDIKKEEEEQRLAAQGGSSQVGAPPVSDHGAAGVNQTNSTLPAAAGGVAEGISGHNPSPEAVVSPEPDAPAAAATQPAPVATPAQPAPPVPPVQPVPPTPPRPLSKRELQGKAGFYQFKLKKKQKGIFS